MSRPIVLAIAVGPAGAGPDDADPSSPGRLATGEEFLGISSELMRGRPPCHFDFRPVPATTVKEVETLLAMNKPDRPDVLHFSGHGNVGHQDAGRPSRTSRDADRPASDDSGLLVRNEHRQRTVMTGPDLVRLINNYAPSVRLVVLNACYTKPLAEALLAGTNCSCVIAMDGPIRDDAACMYGVELYRAIGQGASIGQGVSIGAAHAQAKAALDHNGYGADAQLVGCYPRPGVNANDIYIHTPVQHRPQPRCAVAVAITVTIAAAAAVVAVTVVAVESVRLANQARGERPNDPPGHATPGTDAADPARDRPQITEHPAALPHDQEVQRQGPDNQAKGHREVQYEQPDNQAKGHREVQHEQPDNQAKGHREAPRPGEAQSEGGAQRPALVERPTPDHTPLPVRPQLASAPRHAATAPKATAARESSALGDLDPGIIRRYVGYHRAQVRHCYEEQRMTTPTLAGTVNVHFTITPRGTVTSSIATGLDGKVNRCVAGVLKDIEFPRSGKAAQVNYPFHLHPAEELGEPAR